MPEEPVSPELACEVARRVSGGASIRASAIDYLLLPSYPRRANRAAPKAASGLAAVVTGTPRARFRIAVQAWLAAPPPTEITCFTGVAPRLASLA